MAASVIQGKHVLFIGPVFYHYHEEIIEAIKAKGASVDFFPERIYDLKFGVYSRLGKAEKYQERYYHKILDRIGHTRYDYFLLIKGELLPASFIEELRRRNPNIICVQYQWDSAQRNKYLHLVNHFNKTLTFDRIDAVQYKLEYLPLFYTEKIYQLSKKKSR
ncbi:MAG TPA: hypothetical protein VFS31_16605, partial [Chitinophagaceae bacterium]|nr:hypothetical protein [Chitinophagaceae bacterium]